MHATNSDEFKPRASEADPVSAMVESLKTSSGTDAIRHFLLATQTNAISAAHVVQFFNERGESQLLARLVAGFATHRCPHCRGGFDACSICQGSCHGEERAHVCAGCGGVGIVGCDFCGGSGLATYDLVPEELRPAVATSRVDAAVGRIADALRQPLPTSVPREQLLGVRKLLVKRATETRRDLAILSNAVQFARDLRDRFSNTRPLTARLFVRSSRSAKGANLLLGKLSGMLGTISRACAESSPNPDSTTFETERAVTFETQSREFSRSARRRAALFPGH